MLLEILKTMEHKLEMSRVHSTFIVTDLKVCFCYPELFNSI